MTMVGVTMVERNIIREVNMGFYCFMFVCNMIVPLLMIIAGILMYKKPPKNINGIIGYRTSMSKKNMNTWKFAHEYCGRLWIVIGIALSVVAAVAQIPFAECNDAVIGNMSVVLELVEIAVMIGSIFRVEKALKKKFDNDGNERNESR